jgi:beta-phosphoglucomutase
MNRRAVIFDLDGVLVSTDEFHYRAWKQMASEENIPFSRSVNEKLRGISRMESLEIILKNSSKKYSPSQKADLAERKNRYYKKLLEGLSPESVLPGVLDLLDGLKQQRFQIAVGSSSKNAPYILQKTGLDRFFDAAVDGSEIRKSKPDPEVFLLAAKKLGVPPGSCVVVEDAPAGILAAKAGGMAAVGIGSASSCALADWTAKSLQEAKASDFIGIFQSLR